MIGGSHLRSCHRILLNNVADHLVVNFTRSDTEFCKLVSATFAHWNHRCAIEIRTILRDRILESSWIEPFAQGGTGSFSISIDVQVPVSD